MDNYSAALEWIAQRDAQSQHFDLALPAGGTMRWRRFGSGAPLVLIHGGHGSWMHWARNIDALARHRTLWLPDLPGYGDSAEVGGAGGLEDLLAGTLATLDQLVGAQVLVDIAAFSFGTVVALELAARRPVGRLALLGAAGHGGARTAFPAMLNWRNVGDEAARRDALERNMRAFMLHDAAKADALALAAYALSCERTRFRSKEVSLGGGLRTRLERIAPVPVLALWGGKDVTNDAPAEVAARIGAGLPDTHWYEISGAGHWLQYECAATIDRVLTDWFGEGRLPAGLIELTPVARAG